MFYNLEEYFIIFGMLIFGFLVSAIMILAAFILGPKVSNIEKVSAYECGFEPFDDSKINFDVHFYLVAILFIIFDLEIAFLFPWAYSCYSLTNTLPIFSTDLNEYFSFFVVLGFLLILVLGFIYEWKKGALDWI